MSTDDAFESSLRRRLVDLAESADADRDWADPLPVARERAAAGIAPDDDPAVVAPIPLRAARRRWLPGLAVAAVLLAVVAGAGLGIRALSGSGGSSGAASRAEDGAAGETAGGAGTATGTATGTAGCTASGDATSTGPLAQIATIRPSGVVGPLTTSGGTIAVPYQLTFGQSGGTAQVRVARAVLVVDGQLCATTGTAQPNSVQVVPVEPGPGSTGTATFAALDSAGQPLPDGRYQVVVVITYTANGSEVSQLVSPPVTATVAS